MNVVREEIELQVITPNEPRVFRTGSGHALANAGINLELIASSLKRIRKKADLTWLLLTIKSPGSPAVAWL